MGRVLKPYVKNAIIVVGAEHGKHIVDYLMDLGFVIIKKSKDTRYPRWRDISESFTSCSDVSDFDFTK